MPFDEELKRTFDALGDRLHAELQHQIDVVLAELRAAAPSAAAPTPAASPGPGARADLAPVVEAVRHMDEARSLTDVLDALTTAAAQHASRVVVCLRRGGRAETWRAINVDGSSDGVIVSATAIRLPLAIGGDPVGELVAEPVADGDAADALELLARHASRCLESIAAFKTARALARQANAPADEPANDEDASARRYARLLVSEIKLYHESDVVAGRRDRDLAERLGGEIARARVLYDQRVPPHVRERADYFRDELVRTLADGDSTLLEFHA